MRGKSTATHGASLRALRIRVLRDAAAVTGLTAAFVALSLAADLPGHLLQAFGAPSLTALGHVVLTLAFLHLVMILFGGRRAADMKLAFARGQQAESALWHRARHDELTGLLNRSGFVEELSADGGTSVAVVLIDLDRFKEINDTLGHHVGDGLLTAVAARLRDAVRIDATLARLGGDEFVVLLRDCTLVDGHRIAQRLLQVLRRPFEVAGLLLEIDASLGVAQGSGPEADDLLRQADIAMYAAKEAHAGVAVHTEELEGKARAQASMLVRLRGALRKQELDVHYQPKVRVADGRVIAVEALVRWDDPEIGPVSPDEFVPLAEASGLVRPLTEFVLDQALADCRSWRQRGLELSVAVNLSASSLLDGNLPDQVLAALLRHDLPSHCLEFEITENAAMGEPERALRVLGRLRMLGVQLSVDDYGTGHASLAYLTRLPVSSLKIDRGFVQTMAVDAQNEAIVSSTIELAHSLGLRVVAEGVETRRTWQQLQALGCDEAQGYWLSRPVPASSIPAAITDIGRILTLIEAARPLLRPGVG